MSSVNEKLEEGNGLLRVLAFGRQKTKKTWWACAAAEANFNVLLLDGEDGWSIAKNLSPEARKRVQVVTLQEQTKQAVFARFLTTLLKRGAIIWDEDILKPQNLSPNENCIQIDLLNRTAKDILVIDSWTALVWSLQFEYAIENKIDLAEACKQDWDFYGWGGRLATYFVKQINTLPCHVVVTGHVTEFNKMNKKNPKELDFTREQLISTSNPHSATMGAMFSDILRFTQLSDSVNKISVSGNEAKEGGSRNIKPGSYDWDKMQFSDLCKHANLELPTSDNPLWDLTVKTGGSTNTLSKVIPNKPVNKLNLK